MKSWILPAALILVSTVPAAAINQTYLIDPTGNVNGGNIGTAQGATYQNLGAQGIRLALPHRLSAFTLNTGQADYSQWTHLLVTLTNNRPSPAAVEVAMNSGPTGWAYADVIVAGNATETFAVPLRNATTALPVPSWPALDNFYSQATTLGTSDPSRVSQIRVWNVTQQSTLDISIGQMSLVQQAPRLTQILDQYGQQTVTFSGKVLSDSDLTAQAAQDALLSGQLPYSSDAYQGVAGSGQSQGTGRWRTEKHNGKWYIIDPSGNRFFSTGIGYVSTGTLAYFQDRTGLFAAGALPSQGGSLGVHYVQASYPGTGQPMTGFNFYTANLQRKFGATWRQSGATNNMRRMRTWGFNTIGPTSDQPLFDSGNHFPNTEMVQINGNFRTIPALRAGSAMPDVYDPAWTTAVQSSLASMVPQLNANDYNIGLFVDNELPWAFHSSQPNYSYDLAFDVLATPSNAPAKRRLYSNLLMKYRTIQKLNTAWGSGFASWSAFLSTTNYRPSTIRSGQAIDLQKFLTQFANQYFGTIRAKLNALHFQGLYLGCRFLYYSPEALAAAARYTDVISFNAYGLTPTEWHQDMKAVDKPVLISEVAFGASDLGRSGGSAPLTENDRIQAYQTYVADAMAWPNLVGIHWYKWDDDPATGRMWDNANQNLGLVAITDTPYQGFVESVKNLNTQLNVRLLTP